MPEKSEELTPEKLGKDLVKQLLEKNTEVQIVGVGIKEKEEYEKKGGIIKTKMLEYCMNHQDDPVVQSLISNLLMTNKHTHKLILEFEKEIEGKSAKGYYEQKKGELHLLGCSFDGIPTEEFEGFIADKLSTLTHEARHMVNAKIKTPASDTSIANLNLSVVDRQQLYELIQGRLFFYYNNYVREFKGLEDINNTSEKEYNKIKAQSRNERLEREKSEKIKLIKERDQEKIEKHKVKVAKAAQKDQETRKEEIGRRERALEAQTKLYDNELSTYIQNNVIHEKRYNEFMNRLIANKPTGKVKTVLESNAQLGLNSAHEGTELWDRYHAMSWFLRKLG